METTTETSQQPQEVIDGVAFAKGLARISSRAVERVKGRRTDELATADRAPVVHRDDLVLVPTAGA